MIWHTLNIAWTYDAMMIGEIKYRVLVECGDHFAFLFLLAAATCCLNA
jgi:hypothetical protein